MKPTRIAEAFLVACWFVFAFGACGHHVAQSHSFDLELLQSAEKDDLASVQRFVKKGANIEAKDQSGSTPLMIAVGNADTAMVKFLIDRGARVDTRNTDGVTVLMVAAQMGRVSVVELLLQKGIDQRALNEAIFRDIEYQPMILYKESGSKVANDLEDMDEFAKTVKLLLEKGADTGARNEEGATPLIEAAGFGRLAIVKMLLQSGADLEARSNNGSTALHSAACDCALATMPDTYDVVKLLLEKGAEINAKDNEGYTPLMIASSGGVLKTDIVRVLLENGANPRLKNAHRETALAIAVKDGHVPDVVRLLKNPLVKHH
jgi:ankyrin repeat protein